MLSKIRQYFELIKYCFFGGITTLLNLALLYVFVEMGMNYIVANTIAYIIAVVVNYVFSVFFVFEEKAEGVKQNIVQFGKFCSVRIGSLVLDNAVCVRSGSAALAKQNHIVGGDYCRNLPVE